MLRRLVSRAPFSEAALDRSARRVGLAAGSLPSRLVGLVGVVSLVGLGGLAACASDDGAGGDTAASSSAGDEGDACDLANLMVEPSTDRVALDVWTGDTLEPVVVTFTTSDVDCALSASVDRDWLTVEVDTSTYVPALRLAVVEDALVSGPDVGRVTLQGPDGSNVASIDVDLRALAPGSAGATRHVVVIGIDGLRPDALQAADAPNLDRLFTRGRSTFAASTQLTTLTKSGPGWASILTGVEATKHLVDSNDDLAEMDFTYATMVQRAVDAGFDAKVVTNWFGIAVLTEDGLDKQTFPGNDVAVGDAAVAHVSGAAPQLLFLQFDQVDVAGHLHGFSPDIPQYVTAIENVDDLVGEIVDAVVERPTIAQENWLFVVVTDHSGQDKDHGPMDAIHQTIPLAFAGPTVPHETLLSTGGADPGPSHMDVAPSAYTFLGITISDEWSLDGVARVTAP